MYGSLQMYDCHLSEPGNPETQIWITVVLKALKLRYIALIPARVGSARPTAITNYSTTLDACWALHLFISFDTCTAHDY